WPSPAEMARGEGCPARACGGRGRHSPRICPWPRPRREERRENMHHWRKSALTSLCTILAGTAVAAGMAPALAADISGAGSTFAYPIYSAWGEAYKKETGVALNYQPIGSSDGITKLQNTE